MSLVVKARKVTKKNKTKTRKLSKKNHRKKKQFGGVTRPDNTAAAAIWPLPGTKVIIWNPNNMLLDVFYTDIANQDQTLMLPYNNLVYTNDLPNPMLSKLSSLALGGNWQEPGFGVQKYRYAMVPQQIEMDDFENYKIQDFYFNRPINRGENNMFKYSSIRFAGPSGGGLPDLAAIKGYNSQNQMRYISVDYITPDDITIDIIYCQTNVWDGLLNPWRWLTEAAFDADIQLGPAGSIRHNPWGGELNRNAPRRCRETGNDPIVRGDLGRLKIELETKASQMDAVFLLQGNRTFAIPGYNAGALTAFGLTPGFPAGNRLADPVGPLNGFSDVLYRGQERNYSWGIPPGAMRRYGKGALPDAEHQAFWAATPGAGPLQAFLITSYTSTHCGFLEDTGFWKGPVGGVDIGDTYENPGHIFKFYLSPGIPFLAYDGNPFVSRYDDENEILLPSGILITTDDPWPDPQWFDGGWGAEKGAWRSSGWARVITCFVSFPAALQSKNFIEEGWAGPAGQQWAAVANTGGYRHAMLNAPASRWDMNIGTFNPRSQFARIPSWDSIEIAPEYLACKVENQADINSPFENPQFGGKNRITNRKKSKSKRRFSKKR